MWEDYLLKIEVLLRDPSSTDSSGTEIVPDAQSLEWAEVTYCHPWPVGTDLACDHTSTMCFDCVTSWSQDHYLRITNKVGRVFYSPDYPHDPLK